VNGSLCATYILLFVFLSGLASPAVVGWSLIVMVTVLWLAWVSRKSVRDGIGHDYQLIYAIASTVVGASLASLAPVVLPSPEIAAHANDGVGDFGWVALVR
jgi:hypothetical protein